MSESSPAPPNAASPNRRRFLWGSLIVVVISGLVAAGIWLKASGPEGSYRRGRAALVAGERDVVLRESERLIQTPGYEGRGYLLKGLLLSQAGKLDEAIVWLEKASRNAAVSVEASTAAARCFYLMGRYIQAIDAAHAALELDPARLDARRWLASSYYDLGAVSHAVSELEQVSKEAPADPRPDRLLGLIAKDSEQYSKAIDYYKTSLQRDPNQPDRESILLELAESQIKQRNYQDALATLQECNRSAASLTWEAECLSNLGQVVEAHGKLRAALELDRRFVPAKLSQGKLFLDHGNAEEAVQALREASQIEPQNSQVHFQLSQALRQLGKTEEADAELDRMREIQKLEREFTDLHETAATQPMDADVRVRIGDLAMRLGKPKLAQIWYRAALSINPNHARAQAGLRQLESQDRFRS